MNQFNSASDVSERRVLYIEWGPAMAGALTAAAIAFVLHSFAAAIGISLSSTSPTWRDSSVALQLLTGLYLLFAAIISFGVGGYIAGRGRSSVEGDAEEVEFRDGTLGLVTWAIAILLTVLITWATAQSVMRLTAPSGGSPGAGQSVAGENLIAFDLDRLFRAEQRPEGLDLVYPRSEAARILLTSAGHNGVSADDRAYLGRLTTSVTGLAPAEASKRVEVIVAQTRDNIRRARRSGVILAFMAGSAALVGAAVAWFAACAGGGNRDGRYRHSMTWGLSGPRQRD